MLVYHGLAPPQTGALHGVLAGVHRAYWPVAGAPNGTTATQLAEKFANQAVASTAQMSRQATVDRLHPQRDALIFTETSAETVKADEDAVAATSEQVIAERARGGCKELCRQREEDERRARSALLLAQPNRAATIKAADLAERPRRLKALSTPWT